MKRLLLAMICFIAVSLIALPAAAQCPANPLSLIDGQTWVYQTAESDFLTSGSSTIGRFTASIVGVTAATPNGRGALTVTQTLVDTGTSGTPTVTRLATASGRYIVYPDCSGGELMFMLGGYAVQYEFVFLGGFTEMYLVSDSLLPLHNASTQYGTAKLSAAPACPAGTAPLNYLGGTTWSFHAESPFWFTAGPVGAASVGIFKPTVGTDKNGNPIGVLAISETLNTANGAVTRLAGATGRYTVYPDCSGGELFFNLGHQWVQFEYVLINANEMYMLTDSWADGLVMAGHAKRY